MAWHQRLLSQIRTTLGFEWVSGRQGTGYDKMSLLPQSISNRFKLDLLFIRMSEGVEIPSHVDPVPDNMKKLGYTKHVRMNIIIIAPIDGGEFCLNSVATQKRINIFSPSHTNHSVTKIQKGSRLVLSCGWLKK